jgi:hypothetical protein
MRVGSSSLNSRSRYSRTRGTISGCESQATISASPRTRARPRASRGDFLPIRQRRAELLACLGTAKTLVLLGTGPNDFREIVSTPTLPRPRFLGEKLVRESWSKFLISLLERAKGFEPSTPTLARLYPTFPTRLRPDDPSLQARTRARDGTGSL